ncbi:MAG: DNA-binding protein HU [Opitutaceae bacterium]|nr:DNA-binding protein HU [Opitutaceae bacterium]|tara:strand:- start:16476 stop:16748 length:273 start_codon:yes stop_codon:yes gene_type:complete
MNKADLVDAISASTGLSKADAGKSLDATLDSITNSLRGGGAVSLVGFGNFSVSHRNARVGRNPQTGAEIQISARNAVKFSAGKALKDAVN